MTQPPIMMEFQVPLPSDVYAPATDAAVMEAGEVIREQWISLANDHSVSGAYIAHLQSADAVVYPYMGERDTVAVVNPLPQAAWIEWGRAGFHLPERWGTRTGKWKETRDGRRYATVPFRHRTPTKDGGGSTSERRRTQMPLAIYNTAKRLQHRQAIKASDMVRVGRTAATVGDFGSQSKSYTYYRQAFDRADAPAEHLGHGYTWKSPQYAALTRYTVETHGGGRHTQYMTFRTITEDSPGWYIPPTPAHHYAARALEQAASLIDDLLNRAAEEDMGRAVLAALSPLYFGG